MPAYSTQFTQILGRSDSPGPLRNCSHGADGCSVMVVQGAASLPSSYVVAAE